MTNPIYLALDVPHLRDGLVLLWIAAALAVAPHEIAQIIIVVVGATVLRADTVLPNGWQP